MNLLPDERLSRRVLRKIGQNVRICREKRGWSQERLAEAAIVHDRTIGKIERGELNLWGMQLPPVTATGSMSAHGRLPKEHGGI